MGTKNFVNPLAFTPTKAILVADDLVTYRDSEKQKKDSEMTFSNFQDQIFTAEQNSILYGGVDSIDEDVYKTLGGVNGVSLNSKKLTDE